MENNSMTARVSAFSRAYHSAHNTTPIFNDPIARELLGEEEYRAVEQSMTGGISYFCPGWNGTDEEALRWIVDRCLSATPLARAAFAEDALRQAVSRGARQYLIFGAGLDSFAYRQPAWAFQLTLFEIDHPLQSADKQARVQTAHLSIPENLCWIPADLTDAIWPDALTGCTRFDPASNSFCSLLGLLYYLSRTDTEQMLRALGTLLPSGCSPEEMEDLLERCGFRTIAHLDADAITERYFAAYNQANPEHPMAA